MTASLGDKITLTTRFDEAFRYAHRLHQSQLRKGTAIPYISHLMAVSAIIIEHGGDENQAIAGLLHDAAEDQGGAETLTQIRSQFGGAVADIVADCTDAWTEPKPPWRARNCRCRCAAQLERPAIAAEPDRGAVERLTMAKTPTAESIAAELTVPKRSLLSCLASGTDWQAASIAHATAPAYDGPPLDRAPGGQRAMALTEQGPAVLAALLDRSEQKKSPAWAEPSLGGLRDETGRAIADSHARNGCGNATVCGNMLLPAAFSGFQQWTISRPELRALSTSAVWPTYPRLNVSRRPNHSEGR